MKLIIAFIQPFRGDRVIQALHSLPAVSGASVGSIRGFGRQRANLQSPSLEEMMTGTVPKLRIEVAVDDAHVEEVVELIRREAHTGQVGDGKILVLPILDAIRISSGDRGEAAL